MSKSHSDLVKHNFENRYVNYDALIKNLIPHYLEMQKEILDVFPKDKTAHFQALDIGIGTGETAKKLLLKYPNMELTGMDISPKMLEASKERLKRFSDIVCLIEKDIADLTFPFQGIPFDFCYAMLSVHHLDSGQKKQFFKTIYQGLKQGGVFILADVRKFEQVEETKEKEEAWKQFMISNLGKEKGEDWFQNYLKEDIPETLADQTHWLYEAGFGEVGCSWAYINFAVLVARK